MKEVEVQFDRQSTEWLLRQHQLIVAIERIPSHASSPVVDWTHSNRKLLASWKNNAMVHFACNQLWAEWVIINSVNYKTKFSNDSITGQPSDSRADVNQSNLSMKRWIVVNVAMCGDNNCNRFEIHGNALGSIRFNSNRRWEALCE